MCARTWLGLSAALLVVAPSVASAQSGACDTALRTQPIGALAAGFFDADWTLPLRACPRAELRVGAQGQAIVDLPRRYGAGRVAGHVRASVLAGRPDIELFVAVEPVRYQTVIRSFVVETLGFGHVSLGALGQLAERGPFALSLFTRLGLPTASDLYDQARPITVDVGLAAAHRLDSALRVHAWLVGSAAWSVGDLPAARGGAQLGVGLDWTPAPWLALVLEGVARSGNRVGLRGASANVGVRGTFGDAGAFELSVSLPFVGEHSLAEGAFSMAAVLSYVLRLPA